jgi:hypothetical protein
MISACPILQYLNANVSAIDNASPQEQANKWLSAIEVSVSSEDIDSRLSFTNMASGRTF